MFRVNRCFVESFHGSHRSSVLPLPFVSIHVIEDGKIKLWRDYSDHNMLISKVPQWWLEQVMGQSKSE